MKNITLIVGLFLTWVLPVRAQWVLMKSDGDTILRKGIEHIYNVEFDEANESFRQVIQLYPDHPAGYFLDAMVEWWRINLDSRNKKADQQFLLKIDKVIRACDELLMETPKHITALFFKGGALGFRGRYSILRGNVFSALEDGREALDILIECQKIAPGNHDILLGTGLYNYYAAVLPEKYPALTPLIVFLPRGDKIIGLAQLKAASRKARYAAIEAKVLLVQAYLDMEKNPLEAVVFAKDLHQSYPKNPSFQRAYGRCLVTLGPLDSMEKVFRDVLVKFMDKQAGYDRLAAREALYYIGVGRLHGRDLDMALRYLYKCDEASRSLDEDPSGFMIKTNLRIGQIYDLQGKRDLALAQYNKVLRWNDVGGSHADAQKYVKSPYR